jgi:chromosome segregation ATPase
MQPDFEPMLPPEPRPAPAPLWVWLLVVALGGVSIYAGYTALSSRQAYLEGESVRSDLAQQRDRLKANIADLSRQVEQANRARDEVEGALKQSRANTASASAQLGDLQKQVSEQQQKIAGLEHAREAAEAGAKDAAAMKTAKDAADKEIADLKAQLAASQKKLNQALADLKKEREQVSPVPMGPPPGAPPAGAGAAPPAPR